MDRGTGTDVVAPMPRTTVVITTFNHAAYLPRAIESALDQVGTEVLVVDDGSTDDPAAVVGRYPTVRFLRKDNGGLSSARNAGLRAARTDYVAFLDADDWLMPGAIEHGLRSFAETPGAAWVAGAYEVAHDDDAERRNFDLDQGDAGPEGLQPNAYADFLRHGNHVTMHGAVVYRRSILVDWGGFDEALPACEDYAVLMGLARRHPVARHHRPVAVYRRHGSNMSTDPSLMLRASLAVLRAERPHCRADPELRSAYHDGVRHWKARYAGMALRRSLRLVRQGRPLAAATGLAATLRLAPTGPAHWAAAGVRRRRRRVGSAGWVALRRQGEETVDHLDQILPGDVRWLERG